MNEQTDNQLRDRIREVFENFEDPSADEGWLLLREKYPEKNRRVIAWFWLPIAAAILLFFIGTIVFINYNKPKSEKLSYKPVKKIHQLTSADSQQIKVDHKSTPDQITDLTTADQKTIIRNQKIIARNQSIIAHQKVIIAKASKKNNGHNYNPAATMGLKNSLQTNNHPLLGKTEIPETAADTAISAQNNIASQQPHHVDSNVIAPRKSIIQKPFVLADNSTKTRSAEKNYSPIGEGKKVRFGIYAATYVNYSKGSNNLFNVGAGLSSDIRISKELTLSTGLAISQNTLAYASTPTRTSNDSYFAIVNANNNNNIANGTTVPGPTLNTYNASLIGLNIPIDLKYDFGSPGHPTYVQAGFSSGTFINQTYTYAYSYSNGNPITPQNNTTSINKTFGDFYFAKVLDVSFGFGYPLGRANNLIIEPFLKYPLSGLGDQQIKFGAGGLNLKFNFEPSKK